MLQQTHKSLGAAYLGFNGSPVLGNTGFQSSGTSTSVSHGTNPKTPGNILVVSFGQGTNVITATPPAGQGWVQALGGVSPAGSMSTWYKIVVAGEPASYTWTFSASVSGMGWCLTEIYNVDTVFPPIAYPSPSSGTLNIISSPAITVEFPGMIYTVLANSTGTGWNLTPGTYTKLGAATRQQNGFRYVQALTVAEVITWTAAAFPTTTPNVRMDNFVFRIKKTQ